jgi:nucleotide-binding universal stress UspA family protein
MEHVTYRKILLVVDGGAGDCAAAASAIELASTFHARLIVVNVVDLAVVNRMKRFVEQSATEIEIEIEEKGWRALYHAEEISKGRGVPTLIVQRNGVPDREVVAEAERLQTDLIVVSAPRQAEGQARRLGPGQVEDIIEHAPCAVLVVKH